MGMSVSVRYTSIASRIAPNCAFSFSVVLWVDASSRTTIETALEKFAFNRVRIDKYGAAIEWLNTSQKPWLLLFDNADNPGLDLSAYFPHNSEGCIVITSRNPETAELSTIGNQQLSSMEEHEACDLLLKSLQQELPAPLQVRQDAYNAVKAIDFLALAIVHAAAYIRRGLCDIHEYPARLKTQHRKVLTYLSVQGSARYSRSIYDTLELSMKHLENISTPVARDACELLRFIAFLHFDGISETIIEYAWSNSRNEQRVKYGLRKPTLGLVRSIASEDEDSSPKDEWDRDATREAFNMLVSYSLVTKHSSSAFRHVSIHPVVHIWIKDRIDSAQRRNAFRSACWTIGLSIRWSFNNEDYKYRRYILPHLETCIYGNEGDMFQNAMDDPELLEQITKFAHVFSEGAQVVIAVRLGERCWEAYMTMLGKEHPDTLTSMGNLASYYDRLGESEKAAELGERCWEARKTKLGEEHPDTLGSMSNLAWYYNRLGESEKAAELGERCWEARKTKPRKGASGHAKLDEQPRMVLRHG